MIIDAQGLVLALERADSPGAWQLPQGGLKHREPPLTAALREAEEETGIPARQLQLLDQYPEPLAYELPDPFRSEKTGRGQVHYWFLFRCDLRDCRIDLHPGGEFIAWRWLPFSELLEMVAIFRRPVYRKLGERFRSFLAG